MYRLRCVVNDANRSACTYANMEYSTNRTRDVMMDVRSDVNDVNVKDQVSSTANSENDGTRDVPNKAGVSATCCLKIVSLNVCVENEIPGILRNVGVE